YRSIGQVLTEHRVESLDISDEILGVVRHAAGDRTRDPYQRPVGPVSHDPVLHHLDLRGHLSRNGQSLRVIPVEDELLSRVFLDEITIYGDRTMGGWEGNRDQ